MKKIFSVIASISILANSLIYPFSYAYAQEVISTPEPTPVIEEISTPSPEPTTESSSTPEITPEPTSIPEVVVTSTPTQFPSRWTFENVGLNKEYVAPQNSEVKLTFTKLPESGGNIKIEEITLTEDQINTTGSLSNKAYDITSDMNDGDFNYNLSLPIPESTKGKNVEIKFAEEAVSLSSAQTVKNSVTENDVVSAKNLDHFTIFIITGIAPPSASNIIDDGDANFSTNSLWSNYAAGINDDHKYISNSITGNWAKWTFTDDQLPISGQKYAISVHWVVWDDHVTNATYKLYDSNGIFQATLGSVDQNKNATGTIVPNGTLSSWYKFAGEFTLENGYYIQLVTDGSNSRNIVADAVKIETASSPAEVWVDKSWSSQPIGTDLGLDKVYGYNAFSTIQQGIAAVGTDGTINVATGTYVEVGQIVLDKSLSIIGMDRDTTIIKPAQNTGSSGDSRGWILVNSGKSFTLKNVTLDGKDKLINIGILSHGLGIVDNNIIKNIEYNSAGPDYAGRAIAFYDADTTITNNDIRNYGRIGIYKYGFGKTLIERNIIEGKGTGDHLDYSIEIEGGASAEIKGNIILNNQGVASVDGSTSAGILATTYFASGTNLKITNNSIHDNSYGVALGYNNDSTLVSLFDGNTLNSNDIDFNNYTVNNIDARNNIWSVSDQDNLDQIEAKINHYCSGSTYVHGTCSGIDDYSTGFGMVQYKNIGAPTNSGWNVYSKSPTPNEIPLDVACGGYTNENSVAQNWTAVSGSNIKYQREVTFPSNAISNIEAGSNSYTPFSTFGSSTGIEGLWKTRVRAYVDANSNNTYNSGEEISGWSNECNITFDKTKPINPGTPVVNVLSPTNQTNVTWNWVVSTDALSGVKQYFWNLWKGSSNVLSGTTINLSKDMTLNTYGDGNFVFDIQAEDNVGNKSDILSSSTLMIDSTAPTKPVFTAPENNLFTKTNFVTLRWSDGDDNGTVQSGIKGYTVRYVFTPMNGGSVVNWSSGLQTIGNPKNHSGSYGHGQGTYTVYVSTTDNAGNISQESEPLILNYDATAPVLSSKSTFSGWYTSNQISNFSYTDIVGVVSGTPVSCEIKTEGLGQTCSVVPNVCDLAGNCNTASVVSNDADVDKTSPELNWSSPTTESTVSGVVDIVATASDATSGVDTITYEYKRNDGIDTYHLTTSNWDTTALPLDTYILKVTVTDNAGNILEVTRQVNVASIISNEDSTTPTTDSAVITWTTDRPTKSRVVYDTVPHSLGTAPNYGYAFSTTTFDTSPKVTDHSVTITGLSADTLYYYRVISEGSPVAIGNQNIYRTLSHAGAPGPSGGSSTGGQVQGAITSNLALATIQNEFGEDAGTLNEEVLGEQTESDETVDKTTPKPEVKGIATKSWNAENIGLISLGSALIILMIILLIRKKKRS